MNDFKLEYVDLKPGEELYKDLESGDIVSAVYHRIQGEGNNPDICALPQAKNKRELISDNIRMIPGYDENTVSSMSRFERLMALHTFKDRFKVFLPYYPDLETRFLMCLTSAYRNRKFGLLMQAETNEKDMREVLSISKTISTSVQDMSLIGVAGSGKSSAIEMMLSKYPRGIAHSLSNGVRYLQIPILRATAYQSKETKSLFINLARAIYSLQCYDPDVRVISKNGPLLRVLCGRCGHEYTIHYLSALKGIVSPSNHAVFTSKKSPVCRPFPPEQGSF